MITKDELTVLNHIITDMEDHPEAVDDSQMELEQILAEYDEFNNKGRFEA